jgi:hypothetical protein
MLHDVKGSSQHTMLKTPGHSVSDNQNNFAANLFKATINTTTEFSGEAKAEML